MPTGCGASPTASTTAPSFPTAVRYSGSSLTFNMAGIFGASLTPYAATWLATRAGLEYVGYYLSAAAVLSIVGLMLAPETRDERL